MKLEKRSLFRLLSAGTFLVLCVGGASSALAQTPVVKIGCVLPLSGGSAAVGNQTRSGVITAVEQINAAGGIKALGGAQLQAVFGDSQSKADVGVSETDRKSVV